MHYSPLPSSIILKIALDAFQVLKNTYQNDIHFLKTQKAIYYCFTGVWHKNTIIHKIILKSINNGEA